MRNVLVGAERIELSPLVPETRMLPLHHAPRLVGSWEGEKLAGTAGFEPATVP